MTPREKLTVYHQSEKVKVGNAYFAAPEPAPKPEQQPDSVTEGMKQTAQAFFELSNIYRGII